MNKKLKKKDAQRLFEIELIGVGKSTKENENPLRFVSNEQMQEWLSVWLKYIDLKGYEWVKDELKEKLHDFGSGIYYELGNGKYRQVLNYKE
jgi:hypothetical protein